MPKLSFARPLRFARPDWRITLATIFFCGVFFAAGQWQDRRAVYKAELQARADQRAALAPERLNNAPVSVEDFDRMPAFVVGSYEPKFTVLIDNKVYKGRAGYQVYTPLRVEGGDMHVLVDRGWVAQGGTREHLPTVTTPVGVQRIAGTALPFPGKHIELAEEAERGPVWQNLDPERYRRRFELKLQPIVLEQSDTIEDGLVRERVRPDFGMEKHRVYALQWYSFFGLAIFLYVVLHIKRKPDAQ